MRTRLLAWTIFHSPMLQGSTLLFTDSFALPPISPLELSPFLGNTVMNDSDWLVTTTPELQISELRLSHSLPLFSSGSLHEIIVEGLSLGPVEVIFHQGTSLEKGFPGVIGGEGRYIFDMGRYDIEQGGEMTVSGFDSIETIVFSGRYSLVPEPSLLSCALLALGLGFRRER